MSGASISIVGEHDSLVAVSPTMFDVFGFLCGLEANGSGSVEETHYDEVDTGINKRGLFPQHKNLVTPNSFRSYTC